MATKKPSKYKFTPDMCDRMIELGKEGEIGRAHV